MSLSSQNVSLEKLPNEILVNVLDLLAPADLYSTSLVTKSLNDVVSSVLYRDLFWAVAPNPNASPMSVFERRPWLRSCVRQLLIDDRKWNSTHITEACKELVKLKRLRKIAWTVQGTYSLSKFGSYVDTISRIDTLEDLHLPLYSGSPYVHDSNKLSNLKSIKSITIIEIQGTRIDSQWLQLVKPKLVSFTQTGYMGDTVYVSGCKNLQTLVLNSIGPLETLIPQLADFDQLKTLDLGFSSSRLAAFAVSLPGVLQLDQLETLYLRSNHVDVDHDKWLCQLYRCIASNSRHLREVQILLSDEGKYFFDKGGDIFLATILRHHKSSIRSIGLSCVMVSEPMLARFIHACPQLEEIMFSLSRLDPASIGPILGSSRGLRVIRLAIAPLYFNYNPDLQGIRSILLQSMPTVCKFYLRIAQGPKVDYMLWEVRWVYDEGLQCLQRQIFYTPNYNERPKRRITATANYGASKSATHTITDTKESESVGTRPKNVTSSRIDTWLTKIGLFSALAAVKSSLSPKSTKPHFSLR